MVQLRHTRIFHHTTICVRRRRWLNNRNLASPFDGSGGGRPEKFLCFGFLRSRAKNRTAYAYDCAAHLDLRQKRKKRKTKLKSHFSRHATRHSSYRLDKVVRHAHRHLHLFGVLFEGAANVRVALHQLDKVRIGAGRVVVAKATDRHHAVTVQVGTLLRHEAVQVHGLRRIGAVLFCGGVKAVYF